MSVDKKLTPSPTDAVPWLEEEVRQAKALVHKLQQQMEQTNSQVWVLSQGFQKAEDVLAAVSAQLVALPQVQDEVRQLKEQVGRLHERLLAGQGLPCSYSGRSVPTSRPPATERLPCTSSRSLPAGAVLPH